MGSEITNKTKNKQQLAIDMVVERNNTPAAESSVCETGNVQTQAGPHD